ncbi:type III polyketide synthase [Halalkalibacillus halophilus]|uniref:type III polyketide synthase n=1 Tax=Halalkalibacillus halophilus TaxID=392827 RepID=UPI000411C868|nr:3-oxoacyl-[acyl-carrier-protein] synthase III C-terminal domain-containing protein [Halalkalibacillus halophilus]
MAYISSIGTSVPENCLNQTEVKQFIKPYVRNKKQNKYLSVFDDPAITQRYFAVSTDWLKQDNNLQARNDIYKVKAIELVTKSIIDCFKGSPLTYDQVDCIVSVSSTGILTPTLDAILINKIPLRNNVDRIPLFGLGCAGGAIGLSRSYQYLKAFPDKCVLLTTIELSSVAFHKENLKIKDIVGASIFADGAAAVLLLGCEHPLAVKSSFCIIDSTSLIKEDSLDVMGWEVKDNGFHVVFDVKIPKLIPSFWYSHLLEFFSKHGIELEEIHTFIAHPGGRKILDEIQSIINDNTKIQYSRNVLKNYGNMSSSTVLFVLREFIEKTTKQNANHIITALGPGFSSEILLLKQEIE